MEQQCSQLDYVKQLIKLGYVVETCVPANFPFAAS